MKFYLKNAFGVSKEIEIPDGTTEVAGVILSGDEILIYPCFCDPERYNRSMDFFEDAFCMVLKDGVWVDKEDYPEIETEEE